MAAFNAKDALAMQTRWLHFPHVRFHSGTVTIMARPEEFHSSVWDREGEAKEWARTAWDYVECIDAGPDKVLFEFNLPASAQMAAQSEVINHST
jgi:hypothetical protein